MIFSLQINKSCEESVTVVAHKRTPLTDEIERLVMQENMPDRIAGFREEEITMLDIGQVECFFVEAEKTYAAYSDGMKYLIKKRLYEIEAVLPDSFERINKSAIANRTKIIRFRTQLSGAVDAVFESGFIEYISRRCFSELKRRYDL